MENQTLITNQLVSHGASFFVGFLFGMMVGWLIHRYVIHKKTDEEEVNWERAVISMVVLLVWAVSVVLDIVMPTYSTPTAVHALMGLVTGYFFEGNLADYISRKKK